MSKRNGRIIFFTKYTYAGASSRYRVYQYLPYFVNRDFDVLVKPFFSDDYLTSKYQGNRVSKLYLFKRYLNRIRDVFAISGSDLIYVEYELLPFFFPLLERWLKFKKINYVVDYDDAIFHNYDSHPNSFVKWLFRNKIPRVIENAQKVITGSQYLTQFALKYNKNLVEIPTSIDFVKYEPNTSRSKSDIFTIGWIGTPSSSKNVLSILSPLKKFLATYPSRLLLIGFDYTLSDYVNYEQIELITWSEFKEVTLIKSFDLGIMPLDRTPFNQGKCGFKLIQYMACGLPTISTPLIANVNIDRGNGNLFASTNEEWFNALKEIYLNYEYFISEVGKKNMDTVKKHYSVQANYPSMIEAITELC
jgi:glycosyltransferase involved in cell wall biosynthesis